MMVEPLRRPVLHQHGEVEIVRADERAVAVLRARGLDALLDVLPVRDQSGHAIIERDRRRAGRARETLLQTRGRHVDLPGVHLERVAAERRRAIDIEQHIVLAAQRADLGQGLQHGRGGIAVTDGDHLRPLAPDRGFDLVGRKDTAPFRLDRSDIGSEPSPDLHLEVTEASEDRHQQSVARSKRRCQACFDAGSRRAVDEQCPLVLGSEHAAVERHHLVHVGGELGVELALQGDRHRPQHPRIDVDRPRPHQQARLGIKLGKKLGRRSDLCGAVHAVVEACSKTSSYARGRVRLGGVSYESLSPIPKPALAQIPAISSRPFSYLRSWLHRSSAVVT